MKQYDVIVIGAGSGGLVAATTAHRKGLKTALIEKNKIGGECTHYGCVPSKALINAAKNYDSIKKMADLGININSPDVDFEAIMIKVDEIVQQVYNGERPEVFQNQGIDVFVDNSGAEFLSRDTIKIGQETLKANHFVINTGSSPRIPEIEGIEKASILHNENFWNLREHPKKIVFIGGGVISVEIGQALAKLNCEVCLMDRNPRILKVTDPEIGEYVCSKLEKDGLQLITNAKIIKFVDKDKLSYSIDGIVHSISAEYFFVAAGRIPNVEGMNLEMAGVDYSSHGIVTNEFLQTTNPNIYACGDVTSPLKFTHTASYQANVCIDNIIKENSTINDLSILPWGIFTDPEIGHVGLSEKEAIDKFGSSEISVFKVDANIDRFITDRKTGGLLKVIFSKNDLVLGAEAAGAHAAEWIQLFTLVIKNKIPAQQMADTIFSYPTYSEIVKKAFSRYIRSKN